MKGKPAKIDRTEKPAASEKMRNVLNDADRNMLRAMILKDESNEDILSKLGGRANLSHIYTMKHKMKKEGAIGK